MPTVYYNSQWQTQIESYAINAHWNKDEVLCWFSTEFGKRSLSYLAPTVWNDLPLDTRLSPTADTFKPHLMTVLFP